MSDEPAATSFLDRVNTLSAPAVGGLGAAAGLLLAVLSALSVETGSTTDVAPATVVAAAEPNADGPVSRSQATATDEDQAAAEDAAQDSSQRAHEPALEGAPVPPPGGAEDETPPAEEEAEQEESQDVVLMDPDVGTSHIAGADPEASEKSEVAADSAPSDSTPPPSGRTQSDRDAEAKMDADELLTAATEAYDDRRYKDAYRLATRSQRAKPKDKAQMLRGRSACRLRDEKNAREIVRSFKLGDEHRKTLRTFCKDRGVRVGL
ncbi:MAG: hypothetical protein ACRBN8_03580 [Nannocystales bacterium]